MPVFIYNILYKIQTQIRIQCYVFFFFFFVFVFVFICLFRSGLLGWLVFWKCYKMAEGSLRWWTSITKFEQGLTFPTRLYVVPAKIQVSLRIRTAWSEYSLAFFGQTMIQAYSGGLRRLWSARADVQADLSLRWTHIQSYRKCVITTCTVLNKDVHKLMKLSTMCLKADISKHTRTTEETCIFFFFFFFF